MVCDVVCILNKVLFSKSCSGCFNKEYSKLKPIVYYKSGGVHGEAEFLGEGKSSSKIFRAINCYNILSPDSMSTMCSNCEVLNNVLKVQLSRAWASEKQDGRIDSATNLRFLSDSDGRDRLSAEVRKRRDAERREALVKRKLKELRQANSMSVEWDQDLRKMFNSLSHQRQNIEDPDMDFFWNLQRDMLEKKTQTWHPR